MVILTLDQVGFLTLTPFSSASSMSPPLHLGSQTSSVSAIPLGMLVPSMEHWVLLAGGKDSEPRLLLSLWVTPMSGTS